MGSPMISVAGIRGIVGDSLVPEDFLRYLLAFATLIEGGPVVVGGDSRLSRDMMRNLCFAGLQSAGCTIYDIGLAPTPTVGLMVKELGARGAVAITASHNPPEWNAYKFFDSDGVFLSREANRKLLSIADSGKFRRVGYEDLGKIHPTTDAIERHLARVFAQVDAKKIAGKRFRVVVDCCNGVAQFIVEPLLKRLGCEAELFWTDVNSIFPRVAEPLPENLGELSRRVKELGADIGFASDPDADRLAIVDNTGRPIGEERTVTLTAVSVLGRQKGPIVVNLSTTRAVDDVAKRFGVAVHRTPIGEANVVGTIKEVGGIIGGEGNGGVIFPAVHSGRDVATGIALILEAMANTGKTIAELNAEVPDYVMVKTKFGVEGVDPAELARKMQTEFTDAIEVVTIDGAKAVFSDCWVHLRPSGTEPVVRVFAEAPTREKAQSLIDRVQAKVVQS